MRYPSELQILSTHLKRSPKNRRDHILRCLLKKWGHHHAKQVEGLKSQSPLCVAITYFETYNLLSGNQPKSTRSTRVVIPGYYSFSANQSVLVLDKVIRQIDSFHRTLLRCRYILGWKCKRFCDEYQWKEASYYSYISRARKILKKHPDLQSILNP